MKASLARVAAVLATAICLSLSTSAASQAASPAGCLQAAQLIASGLPQQAKTLITEDDLATTCAAQLQLAKQRIRRAQENAANATRLAKTGDFAAANRRALTALRFDQENAAAVALAYSEKCAKAAQLTQAGFPQRAVTMLTETGETVASCPDQWTQAKQKVAEAQSAAETAEKQVLDGELDQGKAAAASALLIDRENSLAAEVASAQSAGSWTDQLAAKAAGLKSALYNPLSEVLLPWVMVFASILLIARLMVFFLRPYPKLRKKANRFIVLLVGLLAAALASTMLVLGGLWGLIPAVLSVALLSWWLATRLRASISATKTDGDDVPTATHVRALLSELGAAPPKGLEVPVGADATELTGALTAIPGAGSWVTSIANIFVGLLGVTPWRVEIDRVDDERLAVRIARNGHLHSSALIGPKDGRVIEEVVPAIDQQRMAAAFILMTLSEAHGPFGGLGKTRDWRSLGLHYIATADHEVTKEQNRGVQQQTLARALGLDPGNLLAQLAWNHSLWRRSTKEGPLSQYQKWLSAFDGRVQGTADLRALRMRANYTRTAVCLNWWSATNKDKPTALEEYGKAREALAKGLLELKDEAIGIRMDDALRSLPELCPPHLALSTPNDDRLPISPRGLYNMACWYALTPGSYPKAVALLKQVASVPAVKEWMPEDPMLASLRDDDVYKNAFLADPRDDFYALAPLVPHAKALDEAGYGNADVLSVAVGNDNDAPAASLQGVVPWPEQAVVFGVARLYRSLRENAALRPLAVEVLHELVGLRLMTTTALASTDAATTAKTIHKAIAKRCKPDTVTSDFTVGALAQWLAS